MNRGEVKVSVILPVRNGGEYLARSVQSILTQTFRDFELLLINDHSTDGAIERLDRTDSRFHVIDCAGNGVVDAFNQGLTMAKGGFVARMDADDIALPQRLEVQVEFLHNYPDVGIAGACVEIFSDEGLKGGNAHYQDWLNSVRTPGQIHRQLFIESPVPNPTATFRRDAIMQLGGYHNVEWPEDYDLYLRADQAGIRMAKPDGILLRWREHENRLTHRDPRYFRKRFQQAKAHYLAHGRLSGEPVLIWGAGSNGRRLHDLLQSEGQDVCGFIEIHPRRIGGRKRDKPVWDMHEPSQWPPGFILVAVGSRGAREEISAYLRGLGKQEGKDYLFVL